MLLARNPFRDYQSLDTDEILQKLLDIEVKEDQRFCELHWKDEFYDKPFFECPTNDSGDIEKAGAVHQRHKDNCYRAGLPNAPNFHDFRRTGLSKAGNDKINLLILPTANHYKIRNTQNHPVCDLGVI